MAIRSRIWGVSTMIGLPGRVAEAPQLERRGPCRRAARSGGRGRAPGAGSRLSAGDPTYDARPFGQALGDAGLPHAADSGEFRNARRLLNLTCVSVVVSPVPCPPWEPRSPSACSRPWSRPPSARSSSTTPTSPPRRAAASPRSRPARRSSTYSPAGPRSPSRPLRRLQPPSSETIEGQVKTFADNHPEHLARWDAAERSILSGFDRMGDLRRLPCSSTATSAATSAGSSTPALGARRVSASTTCRLREPGLPSIATTRTAAQGRASADHSAIEAVFDVSNPGKMIASAVATGMASTRWRAQT